MIEDDDPDGDDTELDQSPATIRDDDATAWLALLENSRKLFKPWNDYCDGVDRVYANLEKLASITREREFQLFWANVQVLGPSIYSRPPVPVVTTRFKERDPIARAAADMLERSLITAGEMEDVNAVMLGLRDDLNVIARGTPWCRLGVKDNKPWVFVDHVSRRDFLHDPARSWREVDWVAKCSWLTKPEARARFEKISGDAYRNAAYIQRKDAPWGYNETDTKLKAPFWELWSKSANKVVWVAEGSEAVLDEGEPHLELEGFFPCPQPAFGTLQRGTLIPIPDMMLYKDQLEEINEITGRIGALTEAVRVKGFYPAGAGNISDAIESAVRSQSNNAVLIPISNWAAMGTGDPKDMVLWWPIDQIAKVIEMLIELRKQLIDDVYQIMGLSDIMRGSTNASETLGAQELKSQYGSVRIRDKQNELVRVARDITRISGEIMAENFPGEVMAEMSQLKMPSTKEVQGQIAQLTQVKQQIEAAAQQAQSDPQIQQQIQQNPEQAQKVMEQVKQQVQQLDGQIQEAQQTVTMDQVMKFLADNRMRAFTLEIETDSTIQPDEDAAKKRATEYITAMAAVFQQAIPAVQQVPQMAPMLSEMIIFANKQFRVGRTMETAVEEFADQMKQMAGQQKPDAVAMEAQATQAEMQMKMQVEQEKLKQDKEKTVTTSKLESEKLATDWKKALLQAATTLETAGMAAQSKTDTELLKGQIEHELGMRDKQHEVMMASVDHAHEDDQTDKAQHHEGQMAERSHEANAEMTAAKIGAQGKPAAASRSAPRPASPGILDMIKQQMAPAPQAQAPAAPQQDNSDILMAIAQLTRAITAPQQITTPEGRTFTSQRMLH